MHRSHWPLSLALGLLLPVAAWAQAGFTLEVGETSATVQVGETHSFHNPLTNTGDAVDILDLTLFGDDVPGDWTTSLCINTFCLAPFIRTYPDTMEVGHTDDILVDFLPLSEGTGSLWLRVQSRNDPSLIEEVQFTVTAITDAVGDTPAAGPVAFGLEPAYPNPFNGAAVIAFNLPSAGQVRLAVYTVQG
ncbi:MAG TPA: hypothetical protein ENI92_03235, partial [Bacteroidetes bacterium]|nr:hypothetical protein [Bacteroidota bacterium]